MHKAFLIILIAFTCGIGKLSAQKTNIDAKKIVSTLDTFRNRFEPEKVYIHTDKNYYFVGDTIWLKAYVIEQSSFGYSKKSGLLYLELNDDSLDNVKRISIPIRFGIGWAQIPISVKQFHEGRYNLRAYTNWMKNAKVESFFNQTIYIAKPTRETWRVRTAVTRGERGAGDQVRLSLKTAQQKPVSLQNIQIRITDQNELIKRMDLQTDAEGEVIVSFDPKDERFKKALGLQILNTQKGTAAQILNIPLNLERKNIIDLQFLPEGGHLVTGLNSKLAFKAIGENGLGVDIKGSLFDNGGKEVATFSSSHKGMGLMDFLPVAGEKYVAKIFGSENVYALPKIWETGSLLSVGNPETGDSISLNIRFSEKFSLNKSEGIFLICQSRGFACYAKKLYPENQRINIAKNIFPSGIAHFTLLRDTVPINERIIFIDQGDNLQMSVGVRDQKEVKDSTSLHITVTDVKGKPVSGSFSLGVTDDNNFVADSLGNNGIVANLLLTSEIKGYVEDPAYYLNHYKTKSWADLDNLLLSQGWIGPDWSTVFSPPVPKFKAEEQIEISGTVVNAFGKPMEASQIIISSQKPAFINEIKTDRNGKFLFRNLPLLDTASFFIMANTPKGKKLNFGELTLDKFLPSEIYRSKMPSVMPWYASTDSVVERAVQSDLKRQAPFAPESGIKLDEVVIKGKKTIAGSFNSRGADMVLNKNDIKASGTSNLYDLLRSQFPGLKVVMFGGFPTLMYGKYAMHIIINGTGLPLVVSFKPSVQEVVEGLKDYPISSFVGVELQYSRKYNRIGASSLSLDNFGKPSVSSMERAQIRKGDDGFIADGPDASYTGWRVGNLQNRDFDIGLIFLTTTAKSFNYQQSNSASYRPVYVVYSKQFYQPKFDVSSNGADQANVSTIFWKPDIVTDEMGKATVNFLMGNQKGKFSIILQGADLNGNIGFVSDKLLLK
jgi:hypothetical protein